MIEDSAQSAGHRVQQLNVKTETKTKDNVTIEIVIAVQCELLHHSIARLRCICSAEFSSSCSKIGLSILWSSMSVARTAATQTTRSKGRGEHFTG